MRGQAATAQAAAAAQAAAVAGHLTHGTPITKSHYSILHLSGINKNEQNY